jgi:hypothetical protein
MVLRFPRRWMWRTSTIFRTLRCVKYAICLPTFLQNDGKFYQSTRRNNPQNITRQKNICPCQESYLDSSCRPSNGLQFFPLAFQHKSMYAYLSCITSATCPAHPFYSIRIQPGSVTTMPVGLGNKSIHYARRWTTKCGKGIKRGVKTGNLAASSVARVIGVER